MRATRGTVRTLASKKPFQALAERAGFEVPRAVCVANAADLERIATLEPPPVIKPGDKTLALRGHVGRGVGSETLAEAEQICAAMLTHVPGLSFRSGLMARIWSCCLRSSRVIERGGCWQPFMVANCCAILRISARPRSVAQRLKWPESCSQ